MPSEPTYFGGDTPVAVTMGGSTQMDIQAGTGFSGRQPMAEQILVGLGKSQVRL